MNGQTYTRKLDLMDEAVFPHKSNYAQNRNPKESVTTKISPIEMSNSEIIDFVVNEMKDTLGQIDEP